MTIEQANATNVILRELVNNEARFNTWPKNVIDAAALMADKAHKVLMAGLTGAEVRSLLGEPQPVVVEVDR